MATYQISVSWEKTVEGWSNESGADGKHRVIDYWSERLHATQHPVTSEVIQAIEKGNRYGIDVASLEYWEDDPGRFTTNRVENGEGEPDENGTFLADYDIYVIIHTMEHVDLIDKTLGLKSVNG